MDEERMKMMEKILGLTVEFIYLLTGEEYTMVKKASGDHVTHNSHCRKSGDWRRSQGTTMEPPPHCRKPERSNDQEILEIINKILELLTGEVPLRCQDVAVYLSMEEWEYFEGHKDLFLDVIMEDQQTLLTSPDKRNGEEGNMQYVHRTPFSTGRCSGSSNDRQPGLVEESKNRMCHEDTQKNWIFGEEGSDVISRDGEVKVEDVAAPPSQGKPLPPDVHQHPSCDPSLHDGAPPPQPAAVLAVLSSPALGDWLPVGDEILPLQGRRVEDAPSAGYPKSPLQQFGTSRVPRPDKLHTCSKCGKSFNRKSMLVIHRRSHTNQKSYACSVCGKVFPQQSDLARHDKVHTGVKPHPCPECGRRFSQKSDLVKHLTVHTGEKPYSCPKCGKCFSHNSSLTRHKRLHTGEKPYCCAECGKCFPRKPDLSKHVLVHTREKSHSCSKCGRRFSYKWNLIRHERVHREDRCYTCPVCGKSFARKSNLLLHKEDHVRDLLFWCSACGKCFSQQQDLFKHEAAHAGVKAHSCSECGKLFSQRSDLVKHQVVHTGEKAFSCSVCGRCFSHRSSLTRHERLHAGGEKKPHPCAECGKSFTRKSDLRKHELAHAGEKPYSCAECGQCFPRKSDLTEHVAVHTGEMYSCSECGQNFSRMADLTEHERVHTGGGDVFPIQVRETFSPGALSTQT